MCSLSFALDLAEIMPIWGIILWKWVILWLFLPEIAQNYGPCIDKNLSIWQKKSCFWWILRRIAARIPNLKLHRGYFFRQNAGFCGLSCGISPKSWAIGGIFFPVFRGIPAHSAWDSGLRCGLRAYCPSGRTFFSLRSFFSFASCRTT